MKLDEIFQISKGKKPPELSNVRSPDSIPFIQIDGLRTAGRHQFCTKTQDLVTCDQNDILIVWDGAYSGLVGFNLEGAVGSTIARLRPKSDRIFPPYAGQFLKSKFKEIQENATGAAIPHVNGGHLRRMEIPLPPLDEQKRIAAVLDKADALRRQRQESLQLTEKLLQSVFIDMFGDPVTNPKGWERIPFKELLDNIDSGWSPKCLDRSAEGDEWGVLKLGAVTTCKYRWQDNKALPSFEVPRRDHEIQAGDILFSRKNTYALVAASVFVKETRTKLLLPDLIFRFRLKGDSKIAPQYLHRLLITPSKRKSIQQLAGGAAGSMPNISKANLREVLIERPPFELQTKFVERIAVIEEILDAQNHYLLQSEGLFRSLQQRAFRGELDLSGLK
jgi:type I restriction enzyme S subunit